jgi:hypothetical protein
MYGDTGRPLVVPCGSRYLRIARNETLAGRTMWLTRGESVRIMCGAMTELAPPKVGPEPPRPKQTGGWVLPH